MPNFGRNIIRRAFTLIELLVVIAIIAILAAILFPVFAQAKLAALKSVDITRFKQVGTATALYVDDNDARYMMSNSGGHPTGWGYGPPDKVPGMVMMQYAKNTQIFTSAVDSFPEARRIQQHLAESPCSATKYGDDCRLYALMTRSNVGLNKEFFSPWRVFEGRATSATVSEAEIGRPSSTIMFGSSVWDRDAGGKPTGGGNWVIEAPCWKDANGAALRPMDAYVADRTYRRYPASWFNAIAWDVYGGLWPWHNQVDLGSIAPGLKDGQVIIQHADSSVKAYPVLRMADGCNFKGAKAGQLSDPEKYLWDLD